MALAQQQALEDGSKPLATNDPIHFVAGSTIAFGSTRMTTPVEEAANTVMLALLILGGHGSKLSNKFVKAGEDED